MKQSGRLVFPTCLGKEKKMTSKTIVVYHKDCFDGFTSMIIAQEALGRENAEYIPMQYGQLPDVTELRNLFQGNNVYMLDFSMPYDVMMEAAKFSNQLVVLDHHETAQKNLEGLDQITPNTHIKFNMNMAGAMMTWNHFFLTWQVPMFVTMVQDMDLWQFRIEQTKSLRAFLQSQAWNESLYHVLTFGAEFHLQMAIEKGGLLYGQQMRQMELLAERAWNCKIRQAEKYTVAAVCCPPWQASDVGNYILQQDQELDLAVMYYLEDKNQMKISMRARKNENVNVAEICELFNGGGHKPAAGCMMNIFDFLKEFEMVD